MSTLNTSNITVPSVATMTQHLVDSNPHPQYLLGTELLSAISANIHLGDLADVSLGSGIQDRSLIVYGNGTWSNITATELWAEAVIPYATTTTNGVVKLATKEDVYNSGDVSNVITPKTLDDWGSGKTFVSSGNFLTTMTSIFINPSIKVPAQINQMSNFSWATPVASGQAMVLVSYDSNTSSALWTNSTISNAHAMADWTNPTTKKFESGNFGTVLIATEEEVLSGTSKTYADMQSSGHSVPSLASLNSLMGTRFISCIGSSAGAKTSAVYSSIIGKETVPSTGSGMLTVVNNNGLIIDHVVDAVSAGSSGLAGVLVNQAGTVISATIRGIKNNTEITGVMDVISTGKAYNITVERFGILRVGEVITSENDNISSAIKITYGLTTDSTFKGDTIYYTRTGSGTTSDPYVYTQASTSAGSAVPASTYFTKHAGGNGTVTDVKMTGIYVDSSGYWVGSSGTFNSTVVASNGLIHQLVNGTILTEAQMSALVLSGYKQGDVAVNRDGIVEHYSGHAFTNLNVNNRGKAYHVTLSGSSAAATVMSSGYIEDCIMYSGAVVTVQSGGLINGLTIFESGSLVVAPGGEVTGMVKYSPCSIDSQATVTSSARIQKVQFVKEDLLVYSNASGSNISSSVSSGVTVMFTASAHPVGLRRASSATTGVVHSFYPMAVETRKPNATDIEMNDYTINADGLDIWTDLVNTDISWFVVF